MNTSQEVIWVCGNSSAGKETFIKRVLSDAALATKLNMPLGEIAVSEQSIRYPGDITMPYIVEQREKIIEEVPALLKNAAAVLIKWQYLDSYRQTPERLKAVLPEAKHRIFLLSAEQNELARRLELKTWWKEKGFSTPIELIKAEDSLVGNFMSDMSDSFEIIRIDSSADREYRLIPQQ